MKRIFIITNINNMSLIIIALIAVNLIVMIILIIWYIRVMNNPLVKSDEAQKNLLNRIKEKITDKVKELESLNKSIEANKQKLKDLKTENEDSVKKLEQAKSDHAKSTTDCKKVETESNITQLNENLKKTEKLVGELEAQLSKKKTELQKL